MLRLLGFFALTAVVFLLLTRLPVVGGIFGGIPILGFFASAAIVRFGLMKFGEEALHRSKQKSLMRQLGAVDTPYNKGKLGALLLSQRRYRQAAPLLAEAAAGEPDSAEWHYRHGAALLGAKELDGAIAALQRSVAIEEEHAYGAALMRLAEAQLAAGRGEDSLESLARVERNHGESPEAAYRRGLALKALGRKDEARAALAEVGQIASRAVGYQKKTAATWSLRAAVARVL